ncbi:hypothetical protein Dthio_PD3632 [Desulfonatronospira thiodismutans ASO3-1]|uniref:Uncharacterized protein n=1 Tax=Desulfonatronospira thiodismutans ASO3-1 TaxID=555779 RepID=D6SJX3_9BACT|nr:hypothetical protein [Desulfonatronospira thiodismutans]EFI36176.1 hypothetical protein Dthio_PD3632 [Desulfonatronospira thiodismutans ASO3-1]
MQEINIEGWTTAPVEHEFVPGRIREDGKPVEHRYTLHLLIPKNGSGQYIKARVNFWAAQALKAKQLLMDEPHKAHLKIINGTVSDYTCRYTGKKRYSVNVNDREQVKLLERKPWVDDGLGFEAVLNKLQRQHEDQRDFCEPLI